VWCVGTDVQPLSASTSVRADRASVVRPDLPHTSPSRED